MLKGGSRGPALVPGKPEASLLYTAAAHTGDLKMPPGKSALPSADLAALRQWIETGAPWTAARKTQRDQPDWWAFRSPKRPEVPQSPEPGWQANPIDAFVAAKLGEKKLRHAPPADPRELIRRASFDLTGLPPAPERVEEFVKNYSPEAYEQLIEELLASPHYGERWGRHWLDVARYADSGGFETDIFFPTAWRYRDYVIKSFNEDKPYDRFVQEQIAGDELWPDNLDLEGTYKVSPAKLAHLEARIGTGLYTLGPELHESNMNIPKLLHEQFTDAVDTTGSVFLGMTIGCARCHDHKFDPISQRDYYSFQAIFAGSKAIDLQVVPRHYYADYRQHYTKLLVANESRAAYRLFEEKIRTRVIDGIKAKFSPEVVQAYAVAEGKRTAEQEKIAAPLIREVRAIKLEEHFTVDEQKEKLRLLEQLGRSVLALPEKDASQNIAFDGLMEIPSAAVLAHEDPELIPAVKLLKRGELSTPLAAVDPAVPAALSDGSASFDEQPGAALSRRRTLALWLTRPDHPLTARVMVNRIWHGHFGRGLVSTPNDFGRQSQPPSHPELLDFLATEFVDQGWSIKSLHRMIMLSNTYRQTSRFSPEENLRSDPENRYLWRMNRRRLEGEALWDAMHAAAGTLNPKLGGQAVAVPLAEEELTALGSPAQWPVAADPAEHNRRGIYLMNRRNFAYPMMQAFDNPDNAVSCPERDVTTVAPQALWFMNNRSAYRQATEFAARLVREKGDNPAQWIDRAWKLALGRPPQSIEVQKSLELLNRLSTNAEQDAKLHEASPDALRKLPAARASALSKLCLAVFNLSEFVYVD